VHGQHLAAIQVDEDVLGAPAETLHLAARETIGERCRQREAQVRAPLLDLEEPPPLQHGLEARAYGLDFGKLRHAVSRSGWPVAQRRWQMQPQRASQQRRQPR
jgi:hypothetical protein